MNQLGSVGGNVELNYQSLEALKDSRGRSLAWKLLMVVGVVTVSLGFYGGYQCAMMEKDFFEMGLWAAGGVGRVMIAEVAIFWGGPVCVVPIVAGNVLFICGQRIRNGSKAALVTSLLACVAEWFIIFIMFLDELVNFILDLRGGWTTWNQEIKILSYGVLTGLLSVTVILLFRIWREQRQAAKLTAGLQSG
jgi:hypothetical protein